MDFKLAVANEIMNAIGATYGEVAVAAPDIAAALEIPPDTAMGDYAFPCFKLAKPLRKNPAMIAEALAGAIDADFLSKVEAVKGYLNFFIDRATYAEKVIGQALKDGERYGADDSGAGKTVVLDYSSINIAKRFHIGHLSTTMIGNSLYRLHKFFGWNAVGVNHLGDWGTQFGKMIAAYKRWGDHDTVAAGGVDEMVKL
ncbi:MAG: arginine--tRNA ligase, partial [Clostridia bacterium]|nr:arginine--tRNA ligase [Clostridia bacterium]